MVLQITVVEMSVGKTKYTGFWTWTGDFGFSICFRAGKVIETFEKLFQRLLVKKKKKTKERWTRRLEKQNRRAKHAKQG